MQFLFSSEQLTRISQCLFQLMMSHHLLDLDKFNEIYDLEDDIFLIEYP